MKKGPVLTFPPQRGASVYTTDSILVLSTGLSHKCIRRNISNCSARKQIYDDDNDDNNNNNYVTLVHEWIIPTERPLHVGEDSANFSG
jgi:hypothetical protein